MGFNISVHSDEVNVWMDCHHFIDRQFYDFVASYDNHGNDSIVIQSGRYYGLDLIPFTKLVYTSDEVSEEDIAACTQEINFLLKLAESFYNAIQKDNSVCERIQYKHYDDPIDLPQEAIDQMIRQGSKMAVDMLLKQARELEKMKKKNPNPWNGYFKPGEILEHLDALIKTIRCYKEKGANKIYLTAG